MDNLGPIGSAAPLPLRQPDTSPVSRAAKGFGDILSSTIAQVNQGQLDGETAIRKLESGEARHLHEVMIAVEEAEISLRMLVQMRNKALTAYEEIMRMQI
jgi:flagellar hook-basal body complex protein FliE